MLRLNQVRVSAVSLTVSAIISSATLNVFAQESTPVGSTNAYSTLKIAPHYQDETFKQLQAAAKSNNVERAAQLAAQLSDYPIPSYVEYYRIKPQLYNSDGTGNINAPDAEVLQFLNTYKGQAIADRLRNDYLYVLAARRDWNNFNVQYAQFELKDDVSAKCYEQMGMLERGQNVVTNTKKILIDSKAANTKACQQLVQQIVDRGASEEDINYFAALSAYNSAAQGQKIAAASRQSASSLMSNLINQANNNGSFQNANLNGQQSALYQSLSTIGTTDC